MLKLKLQYIGHMMQRTDSLEKTLMLGNIEGRRREQQRIRWLDSIADSVDMNLSSHSFHSSSKTYELQNQGKGSIASKLESGFKPRHSRPEAPFLPTKLDSILNFISLDHQLWKI